MSDDWKRGDRALCIKLGPWEAIVGWSPTELPQPGCVYLVDDVTMRLGMLALSFVEFGWNDFLADRFIKVTPPEADEFDRETIALLTGTPAHHPA